jgi:predicted phosphoadenosine phosphosulfate sulfurtransferase
MMIEQMVRDASRWLDQQIDAQMAELLTAARGIESDPRVVAILRERRAKLAAWRAAKLDELHAALLREIGRLH